LKLVNLSPDKMRSIVVWLLLLSVLVAVVSIDVDGDSTCNKTVESLDATLVTLVATLETEFEQLKAEIKENCCPAQSYSSCKEIYADNYGENKAYLLQTDSGEIPVYCHMTTSGLGACGGGGWTLVMKIDGTKSTFHYDSELWSNKTDFNIAGGKTGFDDDETKLPTYWNTPFTKICLGMRIDQTTNFIVINKTASSLYSLIADGNYRATSLGRDTWKSLVGSEGSLQLNCNREGFNAVGGDYPHSRARIGILGNNENDCDKCDSRVGFGTGGKHDDSNTCGNEATRAPDNGMKRVKGMGYILVQ